jgi:hypothetical protein
VRLTAFGLKNYKNLRDIRLDDLRPINIIHGPNNVGKSNLLEAMAVFFRCLTPQQQELPFAHDRELDQGELRGLSLDPLDMFNLESPQDINLWARLAITNAELDAAGVKPLYPCDPLEIELKLSRLKNKTSLRITKFLFANGTDTTKQQPTPEQKSHCLRFALFLAANVLVREGPADRFAMVGVRRHPEKDVLARQADDANLATEMYDARESLDMARARRWKTFVRVMRQFQDVTGPGEFIVTHPRASNEYRVVLDTEKSRIPLTLLGTGVQQLVSLIGRLLLSNASIVAIEEPELNLRWDLQLKLRKVLDDLANEREEGGPQQVFLSSHSPAFEQGEPFYLLEPGPNGPTLSRHAASDANKVLAVPLPDPSLPDNAPQSYVSSQGVVRIPAHIRTLLGVDGGGSVVFLPEGDDGALIVGEKGYLRRFDG